MQQVWFSTAYIGIFPHRMLIAQNALFFGKIKTITK
jgi:hypothetical protein